MGESIPADTTTDSGVVAMLPPATGTSTPAVAPSDLDALRAQSPTVPVAGVAANDLVDSFDDKRGSDRRHNALDIMAARNTPAVAATAGTILKLHSSIAGGLSIYMADRSARFIMMYGHLDSYRPGLKEGAVVKRGEILGFVGTTGNANPSAPHLHFQVMRSDNPKEWWKGTPLNPILIFGPAP
jgi:murein DD-endopeptidase MepM/ murein hydrolase activator NlpD